MKVDTGELMRVGPEYNSRMAAAMGFTPVPKEHAAEANSILGDSNRAFADMSANTPLIRWAKAERQHRKKTHRAKMSKASRRRNRGRV